MIILKFKFDKIRNLGLLFEFIFYLKKKYEQKDSDVFFKWFWIEYRLPRVSHDELMQLVRRFLVDEEESAHHVEMDITEKEDIILKELLKYESFFKIGVHYFEEFEVSFENYYHVNYTDAITKLIFRRYEEDECYYEDYIRIVYQDLVYFNYDYDKLFNDYCQRIKQQMINVLQQAIADI
jgi:hypothetical protein